MKQTLILLGLAAGVICQSTIKQRLGQVQAKSLAEQCSCSLPASGSGSLPSLGQGTYSNWANGASVTQGETVQTIPSVASTETVLEAACECSNAVESSTAAGTIGKHFQVAGAIQVNESVEYSEAGTSIASGSGASHKQAACVVNNVNGTSSGSGNTCASACLTPSTSGASGATYTL